MALDREKLREYVLVTGAEEMPDDDGILRYYRDFLNDILVLADDLQNQYKRRALIKSASAAFESSAFELWEQLKKIEKLTEDAKWVLKETHVTLADNGQIKTKKAVHPLSTRFKFVFVQLNEILNEGFKFTVTSKLWNSLRSFQETRNMLLHPSSKEVPTLTDGQIQNLIDLSGYIFTLVHLSMLAVSWDIARNNRHPSNIELHNQRLFQVIRSYQVSFNYLKHNGILTEVEITVPSDDSSG